MSVLLLALALRADSPSLDLRLVLRQAVANQERAQKLRDDYTFTQRQVQRQLDGKGRVKSTKTETHEVTFIEGSRFRRLVARDDKPLSEKEQLKEQERAEKETRKRIGETPAERQKRLQERERNKKQAEAVLSEFLDAFDFRLMGREPVAGVPCLLIEAKPRAGFTPRHKEVAILKHMSGHLWITEQSREMVKFDATVDDTISLGLGLARVNPGTRLSLEQVFVNNEIWLPKSFSAKAEARLALIKKLNMEAESTYSDYKKFRVESSVVSTSQP